MQRIEWPPGFAGLPKFYCLVPAKDNEKDRQRLIEVLEDNGVHHGKIGFSKDKIDKFRLSQNEIAAMGFGSDNTAPALIVPEPPSWDDEIGAMCASVKVSGGDKQIDAWFWVVEDEAKEKQRVWWGIDRDKVKSKPWT